MDRTRLGLVVLTRNHQQTLPKVFIMGACDIGLLGKSVILIFNIVYTVVGLAFLGVGVWLRARYPDETLVTGEYVLIAVGIVMLITAITGDLGGCTSKTSCLATFCVLLAILMAAQLALYVQRQKVDHRLAEFYGFLYEIYISAGDPVVGGTLRVIHYTLNCCGAVGVVGLDPISSTCPARSGFLERFISPCPTVLLDVFSAKPPLAMGIFYGNAVLMVATMAAAGILLGPKIISLIRLFCLFILMVRVWNIIRRGTSGVWSMVKIKYFAFLNVLPAFKLGTPANGAL
ncbi:unnamed protein product [Arctogadus glacialis]